MNVIARLTGAPALSQNRLGRLLKQLSRILPTLSGIQARYLYFVECARTLDAEKALRLNKLLDVPLDQSLQSWKWDRPLSPGQLIASDREQAA